MLANRVIPILTVTNYHTNGTIIDTIGNSRPTHRVRELC